MSNDYLPIPHLARALEISEEEVLERVHRGDAGHDVMYHEHDGPMFPVGVLSGERPPKNSGKRVGRFISRGEDDAEE